MKVLNRLFPQASIHRLGSGQPRSKAEPPKADPSKAPPSPRATAGDSAPASFASAGEGVAALHVESRSAPAPKAAPVTLAELLAAERKPERVTLADLLAAEPPGHSPVSQPRPTPPPPELNGIKHLVNNMNKDGRSPTKVVRELKDARNYYAGLLTQGKQTSSNDIPRASGLVRPILHAENARNPGLNAVVCENERVLESTLRKLGSLNGGQEGHIRIHFGSTSRHRIAVDAFKHREGGFTLIAVDSEPNGQLAHQLTRMQVKNPDILKATVTIPAPNQIHMEGCHIFTINTLNALHDHQPYIQTLHQQAYDEAMGRTAPQLAGSPWFRVFQNNHTVLDPADAFNLLPAKFFKHIQVRRPHDNGPNMLDIAEKQNPALIHQPVNKKGQTLRQRVESANPDKALEHFSRAERTSSLDKKRLVLIDRALEHFQPRVSVFDRFPIPRLRIPRWFQARG